MTGSETIMIVFKSPFDNMCKSCGYSITEKEIYSLAARYGWTEIVLPAANALGGMLSFHKNGARINVWMSKMTVSTAITHPIKGKTQLYRRHVRKEMLETIFVNPRQHTKIGYYTK